MATSKYHWGGTSTLSPGQGRPPSGQAAAGGPQGAAQTATAATDPAAHRARGGGRGPAGPSGGPGAASAPARPAARPCQVRGPPRPPRGAPEGVDVGPDEVGAHPTRRKQPLVVGPPPLLSGQLGLVGVQVGQQPPVAVHHLTGKRHEEPQVVLGLAQVVQGLGGRLGQAGVVGGRPGPDPACQVLLSSPSRGGSMGSSSGLKGSASTGSQRGSSRSTNGRRVPGRGTLTSGASTPRKRTPRLPVASVVTVSPSWTCWATPPGCWPRRPSMACPTTSPDLRRRFAPLTMLLGLRAIAGVAVSLL